jgi:4-diphosphocytidyl-2-C-methyl-D-erythritol kinase
MSGPRRARLLAFAKINLDLRVLYRREDDYHELRTIFQTISLADRIDVSFTPSRKTTIRVSGNVAIPDNLMVRAAESCLDAMRVTGEVEFTLDKRIPMGAGLGGGSSDAAAVLIALPVLAGKTPELPALIRLAGELGSDVPFFLLGGAAVAVGRGTELYPLPDGPPRAGVVIAPDLHVSTADAYRRLSAELTSESQQNKIVSFQSQAWRWGLRGSGEGVPAPGENDFESIVFRQHPGLKSIKRRLEKLGARPAMMSGSGSAVFGLFQGREQVHRALPLFKEALFREALFKTFREERVFLITLVSRAKYRSEWFKRLRSHTRENQWLPQSRYAG